MPHDTEANFFKIKWTDLEALIFSAIDEFFILALFRRHEGGIFGGPGGERYPGVVEYFVT